MDLLDEFERLRERLEAKYFIETAAEYRMYHQVPDGGELVMGEGAAASDVTAALDSAIEDLLPTEREYTACDAEADAPRDAFGRYLTLARERAQIEAVLGRMDERGIWPTAEGHGPADTLHGWRTELRRWMAKEHRKLLDLATEAPTPEAIDFLMDLFFSDDLFFKWHGDLLAGFSGMPPDAWQEKLLETCSSLTFAEFAKESGRLLLLDHMEVFADRSALSFLVACWIEELRGMIESGSAPPELSSEEKLLRAIFGSPGRCLDHPHELLEDLGAAARELSGEDDG